MSPASLRDLAQRLIAHEKKGRKSAAGKTPGGFLVCGKFCPHLATLMGKGGAHALLARALAVASVESPWLRTVQLTTAGGLEVRNEPGAIADPEEVAAGSSALVAQLLALLVLFVGAALTLQMLREVWPTLSLRGFDSREEDPP